MSRIVVNTVVAFSILHAGLVAAQGATDRPAVEKQIVSNEKAIMDAIVKNDLKTFHSHVVPDSFALGEDGLMKVADYDKIISEMNADCKFSKAGINDSSFYWVNDATVVHIYKAAVEATCKGGDSIPPSWSSTVWTNKGGKWLGAFHHESRVAPPATPKK